MGNSIIVCHLDILISSVCEVTRSMSKEYTFKIVVGGAGGVGKTTLLNRYLHGEFKANTMMTIGVGFLLKELSRKGCKVILSMWDLGGQDRFRFLQGKYCLGARGAIIFFNMTRMDTMGQVKDWVTMVRQQTNYNIPIVLGGTKLDLVKPELMDDVVNYATKTVAELGLSCFMPTSSKTGMNVNETLEYIVDAMIDQAPQAKAEPDTMSIVKDCPNVG